MDADAPLSILRCLCASMPCSHLYRRSDLTGTTEEDKFLGETELGIGPMFPHFWVLVA